MRTSIFTAAALITMAASVNAQTVSRKATLLNGGNPNGGKCTVEVVVDASAEIEIRGDTATLRNTGGQAPQWRRFECTGPMPANPANFRFAGVDGRGSQTLIRDPRNNNGAAVVRIVDNQAGAEGYTFDVFWGEGNGPVSQARPGEDRFGPDRGRDQFGQGQFGQDRRFEGGEGPQFGREDRDGRRFVENRAMQSCQDAIIDRAYDRFGTTNINIRSIFLDNDTDRRDGITGELAVPRRFGRQDIYRFFCSIDFDTGRVRFARIDQFERSMYPR